MRPRHAATAANLGVWPGLSAEDRFAQVIEALPIALVLTEPGGRIEMANRHAALLFGYARGELPGQLFRLLIAERFRDLIDLGELFLTNRASPVTGAGWDLSGLRANGDEFPLELDLNPIDLDGAPMLLAAISDIATRRETERQIQLKQLELERSNADLEEFAYAASHDLKAPLRAISHLAEWIGEDVRATAAPDTLDNLALLHGRVARLQMLLDGLLDYSRVGRATDAETEDIDVAEMVRDIAALLAPPAGFVIASDADMPTPRTHRAPLHLVLKNLIGNAIKHHDRPAGRIDISLRLRAGVAEFRVADDGPGIAAQFHERVFVIFQTLASRDDIESSGIGLAIARKKVTANGGRIWIESGGARGATFAFTWRNAAP